MLDQSPPRWPHVMKDLSEDRGANTVTIGAAGLRASTQEFQGLRFSLCFP